MQTAKLNSVPGCPRVEVLSISNGIAQVRSDEAEPGHELLTVSTSELSSFEGEPTGEGGKGLRTVRTEEAASVPLGHLIEIGPGRMAEVYANERLRDESGGQEMTRIETMGKCVLVLPARMPVVVKV